MRRRLLSVVGFGTGALAGTVLFRRTLARTRERVDLYFEDGSMMSFVEGSQEAEALLPVARSVVAATRR
jgi:hypothetical protein